MEKKATTPGGRELRELRKHANLTQEQVEMDSGIGKGRLHLIEQGKTKRPTYETLEKILDALGAKYSQRRRVLELYGYIVPLPEPTDAERTWVFQAIRPHLISLPFPAYLLDCADLLLDWNDLVLSITGKTAQAMEPLRNLSLNYLLFDEQYGLTQLVAEPENLFPNILRAFWREIQPYKNEPWCHAMLETTCTDVPLFKHYWEQIEPQLPRNIVLRPALPIMLRVPQAGVLAFRVSSDYVIPDTRFRVVSYIPSNATTMHQCARWAAEQNGSFGMDM